MTAEPVSSAPAPFLPLWRRILVTSSVLLGTAALAWLSWPIDDPFVMIELSIFALTAGLMHVPRAEAAVFCRATWWAMLIFSALGTAIDLSPNQWPLFAAAMIASAIALLAIGRAGVTPGTGAFTPKVLSSSLVAMMTVALCIAHLFVLMTWSAPTLLRLVPIVLVAATIGLARTRSWGLFLYLAVLVGFGGAASVLFASDSASGGDATLLSLGAGLLFVTAAPVMAALIFRRRPAPPGRPWGGLVHGLLVVLVIGLALWARYLDLQLID